MNQKNRFYFLSLITVLVLLANLAFPINAFADDATPPPEATEAPAQPPPDPIATEAPAQPPTDPVATEAPVVSSTQEAIQEPAQIEEDTTVAGILDQLPDNTNLVVLNSNGDTIPLATEEAAEIINEGDPVWCPTGALPGDSTCTTNFARLFNGNKNNALIPALKYDASLATDGIPATNPQYTNNGTIYIKKGNLNSNDNNQNIILNGNQLTNIQPGTLVIQGGWDFDPLSLTYNTVIGQSVFSNSTLQITNWGNNVTINDLKFDLASGISGDGLTIRNITGNVAVNNIVATGSNSDDGIFINSIDGTVSVNNSKSNDNAGNGATIQNVSDSVSITGSEFRRNAKGLEVSNVDSIALDNVVAQKNDLQGADLSAYSLIQVSGGSSFNINGRQGLKAEAYTVNISNSDASYNGTGGPDRSGFRADGYDVTLTDVYAAHNGLFGANVHAGNSVTIQSGSLFEYNDGSGLHVVSDGDIALTDVTASNNGQDGAILGDSCGCILPNTISINSSNFTKNGWNGLEAYSYGEISLTNVTADGNLDGDGAHLDNTYGSGDIFVDPSQFNNNSNYGLNIFTNGNINLSEVTANGNGSGGVYLSTGENATICDSDIESNGNGNQNPSDAYGVNASNVAGTLTLGNITFSGNTPGDYSYSGSNLFTDCNSSSGGGSGKKGSQSRSIIPVTGGQEVTCQVAATSTTFELPNGDKVTLPCPINDSAFVNPIVEGSLPGSFGDGHHFLSALNANVIRDSQSVQSLDKPMTVSFVIPAGIKADELAIMLWDGTQWVKLDGKVSADGLHFEVITKSTGSFALVNK